MNLINSFLTDRVGHPVVRKPINSNKPYQKLSEVSTLVIKKPVKQVFPWSFLH